MARYSITMARYREAVALEMAVDGVNWTDIGEALGYAHRSGAWKAAQRALRRRLVTAAERYVGAELVELECLIEKHWLAAVSGSVAAADVVLRAMDQRWRLYEAIGTVDG